MSELRQINAVAVYNFRQWPRNPRIYITFALAFILCFLLSDKAVRFAQDYSTTLQLVETFVWTFGDSNSILLSSLLLVLLFADMPLISAGTPFYLIRTNRTLWLIGQAVYITLATGVYMMFILLSTILLCLSHSFTGNMWSKTAAILAYSGDGTAVALPALVKTLEMSTPYECMGAIFLLMLLYTLLMAFIMLTVNIRKGQLAGSTSVFAFSLFGFLLKPQSFETLFQLPKKLMYKANVAVGWLSPLNQATYSMHNFGYDQLPRLWQTYILFIVSISLCFIWALRSMRKFNFHFAGMEG
ncbi:MAG: hypothetical protein VB070_14855 [Clostridiaceae bacterium]|nr:hypothetical protein [Clostridiaceae bacterium]